MDLYELTVRIKGDLRPLEKAQEDAKKGSRKRGNEAGKEFADGAGKGTAAGAAASVKPIEDAQRRSVEMSRRSGRASGKAFADYLAKAIGESIKAAFSSLDIQLNKTVTDSAQAGSKAGKSYAQAFAKNLKAFGNSLSGAGNSLTLGVSTPLLLAGKTAFDAAVKMDRFSSALKTIMGDSRSAAAEIEKLKEAAAGPGLSFEQAVKGSVQLQSVGYSADEARKMLALVGNELAKFGGTQDEFERIVVNMRQVASMGKLTGDELREIQALLPSFGRNLKAAFGTMDSQELAKRGVTAQQVFSEVFKRLEKESKASTDTMSEELKRLNNDFFILKVEAGKTLAPFVKELMDVATPAIKDATKWLQSLSKEQKENLVKWATWAVVLGPVVKVVGSVASGISSIAKALIWVKSVAPGAFATVSSGAANLLTKFPWIAQIASKFGPSALATAPATVFSILASENAKRGGIASGKLKGFTGASDAYSEEQKRIANREAMRRQGILPGGRFYSQNDDGSYSIYRSAPNANFGKNIFNAPPGADTTSKMLRILVERLDAFAMVAKFPQVLAAAAKSTAVGSHPKPKQSDLVSALGGPQTKAERGSEWKSLKELAESMRFVVTSTTGGKHNVGSAHYDGRAIDVRTRGKSESEIAAFRRTMEQFGAKVIDERTRPPGQKVWGGPHLHVQVPKGWGEMQKDAIDVFSGDRKVAEQAAKERAKAREEAEKAAAQIVASFQRMLLDMRETLINPKGEVGKLNRMNRMGELSEFSKPQIHQLYATAKEVDFKANDRAQLTAFAEHWRNIFLDGRQYLAETRVSALEWFKSTVPQLDQVNDREKTHLDLIKEQLVERGKALTVWEKIRILAAAQAKDEREASEKRGRFDKAAGAWWQGVFNSAQQGSRDMAKRRVEEARDAVGNLRREFDSMGFGDRVQLQWVGISEALGTGATEADRLRNGLEKIRPVLSQIAQATRGVETTMTGFVEDVFGRGLGTALDNLPRRFASIFGQIAQEALMAQARAGISNWIGGLAGSVFGGKSGGGGSAVGFGALGGIVSTALQIPGMIKGKRAGGGPVLGGMGYVVGEKEPEVFVPDSNGQIYNQAQLAGMGGGGTVNLTINVSVPDASSQASRQQVASMIASEVQRALRNR